MVSQWEGLHPDSQFGSIKVTKGSYQVALPDGRTQIVNYIADVSGFKATVSYEGEAVYPGPGEYGSSNQHPVIAGEHLYIQSLDIGNKYYNLPNNLKKR